MNLNMLKFFVFAGICFGLWPQIMKRYEGNPLLKAFLLGTVTTAIISIAWICSPKNENMPRGELFSFALVIPVIAAVLNGVGTIQFMKGMDTISPRQFSGAVLLMILTQVTVNELAGMVLHDAPFTVKKLLGFGSAIAAFFLLVA